MILYQEAQDVGCPTISGGNSDYYLMCWLPLISYIKVHFPLGTSCSSPDSLHEKSLYLHFEKSVEHSQKVKWDVHECILTLLAFSKYFLYRSSICFISSSFFRKASCNSSIFKATDETIKFFLYYNNFKNISTNSK